jgi:hypothetical protein
MLKSSVFSFQVDGPVDGNRQPLFFRASPSANMREVNTMDCRGFGMLL